MKKLAFLLFFSIPVTAQLNDNLVLDTYTCDNDERIVLSKDHMDTMNFGSLRYTNVQTTQTKNKNFITLVYTSEYLISIGQSVYSGFPQLVKYDYINHANKHFGDGGECIAQRNSKFIKLTSYN